MKVSWLSFALAGSVSAFWRLECHGRSGVARIDPLVNPGTPASHAHAIHGGNNFGFSSGYDDLRASECTSCSVKEDLSAYWFPPIYFEHSNGTIEMVPQVGGMLVYYIQIGDNVKAFPRGFSMISGDTRRRNFTGPIPDLETSVWTAEEQTQSSLEGKALGFNCLNYNRDAERFGSRHFLPTKDYMDENCKDGIRLELVFPSCWNGKDTESPDQSHVAFSSLLQGGTCPEGFETRIPTILFESIFNTNAFNGVPGRFVIGNGDPTGNGFHGDLISGWEPDFLQGAIDQCKDASGQQSACPLFTIQDEETEQNCKIDLPSEIRDEDCLRPGNQMPGNVQIYDGPGYAPPPGSTAPPASTTAPPQTLSLGYTPGELVITDNGGDVITIAKAALPGEMIPASTLTPNAAVLPAGGEAQPSNVALVNAESEPAPPPPPATTTTLVTSTKVWANIVATTTFTSAGAVYEVEIEEVYVTVTETQTINPIVKRMEAEKGIARMLHHHRNAHRHAI
ncbi:hypothetical protein P152DRAFT_294870 [Eremomyces bilateralis CBS 781.70]|uniref:DUF1996 domain-containing protein n=1 Tax=Eremomyces bilateralis CBS 781.70 TaxID=1392243 RepID=A0A6G1G7F0_9PEZI|nr:uncharacterized protein P152DRAFT_294870 [Eremomyces bilateralis CBS 781.70]KAF1813861.1 hypothetical protein P152DRAFT_294870 [Eremomyces bilateralis CBS 781.70]